jgi:hypothetical protein
MYYKHVLLVIFGFIFSDESQKQTENFLQQIIKYRLELSFFVQEIYEQRKITLRNPSSDK